MTTVPATSVGLFGPAWSRDRMLVGDRARWREVEVTRTPDERSLLAAVRRDDRVVLLGRGDPAGAVALVREGVGGRALAPLHARTGWMSLPRGSEVPATLLHALGLTRFSSWDWLATDSAPDAVPGEELVRPLDPGADVEAARACLAEANPGTTADPTGPDEVAWLGVDGPDGSLAGVVGASSRAGWSAGGLSWHLHGLGVRRAARGRGLGAALTAAVTRAGLAAGADWVSLGMYADNDTARRIYHRLGYVTEAELDSYGPAGARRPPG